jgi:ubiquinol-cytochrome c reductase cytochrome c1 subunit
VLPGAGVATANQVHSASEGAAADGKSWLGWGVAGAAAAAVGAGTHIALAEDEAEHGLHAPQHPWSHEGPFSSYDHAAIRRGYQVYQQVCSGHTVL